MLKHVLVFAVLFSVACGDSDGKNNTNNQNNQNNQNNTNNQNNGNNQNNANNSNNVNNSNNQNNVNNTTGIPADLTFLASTVSSDFSSSRYAWVYITFLPEISARVEAVDIGSGDVGVAASGDRAFVIDRGSFPDNDGTVTAFMDNGLLIEQFTVSGNPKDVAFANEKTYVTQYNAGSILIRDDAGVSTDFDLSNFDDDQNPEPDALLVDGDYLLVVMQKLTNFVGVEDSCVAVIDTTTDSIVDQDPITDIDDATCLVIKNAWAGISRLTDQSWAIGGIGDFGVADSGLVEIRSPNGGGLYESTPMFVSEPELGGDIYGFSFPTTGLGLVSVDVAGQPTLKVIDARMTATWQISDAPFSIGDTSGAPIDSVDAFTVVGVRDANDPKFLLLDASGVVILEIPVEYQPYDVALALVP